MQSQRVQMANWGAKEMRRLLCLLRGALIRLWALSLHPWIYP
jgi:hypothetical protein